MIFQFRSITFFGSCGNGQLLDMVALSQPLLIVRLVVSQVEGVPTLGRDLEGAYIRLAAVGLIARQLGDPLVVDLEELRIGQVESPPRRIVCHVLFEGMRDQRQAAGYGAGGVDDAYPVSVGLSIERPGVVVNAIGEKLEAGALRGRIAILAPPSDSRA